MYWYLQALKKVQRFSAAGRGGREYWQVTIVNAVIFFGLSLLAKLDAGIGVQMLVLWLATTYSLWMILPSWAVLVRRLHDTNHSGWWLLIGLVPIVGAIALFIWMVADEQPRVTISMVQTQRRLHILHISKRFGGGQGGGCLWGLLRSSVLSQWAASSMQPTGEPKKSESWRRGPGSMQIAAEVATVDLTPLGLQKTGTRDAHGDVRIRCAVRRRCGDRVWGGWKPIGGRDSAAIFEHCGRGQSLQQPSGVGAGKLPDEHLRQLGQLRSHPLQVRQRPRPDPVER